MFIIDHYQAAVHIGAAVLLVTASVPLRAAPEAPEANGAALAPSATGAMLQSSTPIPTAAREGGIIAVIEPGQAGLGVILFDPDGSGLPSAFMPDTSRLGRR